MADFPLENKKFLLVEDSMINAMLFNLFFKSQKAIIHHAENGPDALEMLDKEDYDFIIMDLQMPVMDGFEVLAEVRSRKDEKAKLPVIVVTASVALGIKERCLNAGFDDFLKKPFTTEELFEKIKNTINLNSACNSECTNGSNILANVDLPVSKVSPPKVHFDLTYLKSFSLGEKEFEKDMLESSLVEMEEKMQELDENIQRVKTRNIMQLAHSLKSLASIVGIGELHTLYKDIELNSDSFPIETIKHQYLKAKEIWQESQVVLNEFIIKEYN